MKLTEIYNGLRAEKDITLYAVKGIDNNRETFTVNIKYSQLPQVFKLVPHNPDSQLMIQRETHKSRVSAISSYLRDELACLPATGAIVETINHEHVVENIYKITIPKSSFRYLFDGQGRLAGVFKLLETESSFGDNTLTVKMLQSLGVNADNQVFHDWNSSGIKPNKSICQAMDSRAVINSFAKDVIGQVSQISNRIDFTKASVTASSKSDKLWTLNQFVTFVQMLTGTTAKSAESKLNSDKAQARDAGFIKKYFALLAKHPQLEKVFSGDYEAPLVRENTVIGTSVFLKSLAMTGKVIYLHMITQGKAKADWSFFEGFYDIDFSKQNDEWKGRCLNYLGKFEDKAYNHKAMSVYFLDSMGIELPEELDEIEATVLETRAHYMRELKKAKRLEQQSLDLSEDVKEVA